jgi:hypothetical protein
MPGAGAGAKAGAPALALALVLGVLGALTLGLAGCGSADRSLGQADAVCIRYATRLAGARSSVLSGQLTTAGQAAADLRKAGLDPSPWSGLTATDPVAACSYSVGPVDLTHQPEYLFVDRDGRSSPEPLADAVPAEVTGP